MIGNPMLFGEGDNPSQPITPVRWIQSDGTSYIDTGLGPPMSYNWRLEFILPRAEDFTAARTPNDIIVAAADNSREATYMLKYGIYYDSTVPVWKDYYRNGDLTYCHKYITTIDTSSLTGESDVFFETWGTTKSTATGLNYCSQRNVPLSSLSSGKYTSSTSRNQTSYGVTGNRRPSGNIHLFGFPSDTSRTNVKVRGFIFYTQSQQNYYANKAALYRHFIPALKNNEAGLYDLVTKTFIGNSASSGTILWGND